MSLRIDRPYNEQLAISMLTADAREHNQHGWDAAAWLTLCCARLDCARRGIEYKGTAGSLQRITVIHRHTLPMVATFAFRTYPRRN